jgi:hypothetical protein
MTRILCLGGGWQQIDVINLLIKSGHEVIVVDKNTSSPGFALSTSSIPIDFSNTDALMFYIQKNNIHFDICVSPNNESGIYPSNVIASHFKKKSISNRFSKFSINKLALKEEIKSLSIAQPLFERVNLSNLESTCRKFLGMMIVVKPIDGAGSRGVSIIKCTKGRLSAAIAKALAYSNNDYCLIEEFIDGVEFSIESFSYSPDLGHDIISISERHMNQSTSAIAIKTISSHHPMESKLREFALKLLAGLQFHEGPAHIEVIVCKNGYIYPIDIGFRTGGFWVGDKLATKIFGINPNILFINLINGNIDKKQMIDRFSECILLYPRKNISSKKLINKFINLNKHFLIDQITFDPLSTIDPNSDSARIGIEFWCNHEAH